MKRILFVDDEVAILDGLRRMLRPMRAEWEMVFAASGREALDLAAASSFDVIVSDMRMPGMDGAELLAHFHRTHPATLRFVLSGYSESETVLRASPIAHRFLSKPCDPDDLKEAVVRSLDLAGLVRDSRARELVHGLADIPPGEAAVHAVRAASVDSADASELVAAIESDMALTAKTLQLVNSTLFDPDVAIGSVAKAVALLGPAAVRSLVDTRSFAAESLSGDLEALRQSVQARAAATAAVAKRIEGGAHDEAAFTAGLLHDVGILVLASSAPDQLLAALARAEHDRVPLIEAEAAIGVSTHAEIGGYLLGLWGLPRPIVDAVAYHHRPGGSGDEECSTVTAVHIASVLVETASPSIGTVPPHRLDLAHIGSIAGPDRLADWRLLVGEDAGVGWPVGLASSRSP